MSSETTPANGPEETNADPTCELPTPAQWAETKAAAARGAEAQERYVRLYADFENFKKRAQRERDEARRNAVESVVSRFLPVLDNLEMALAAAQQPSAGVENIRTGVAMIHGQFKGAFGEYGIEEIDAVGQPFDPSVHEAVSQVETTEVPEGQVVQQLRKGYRNRERLLRPASVVVARPPATDLPSGN